MGVKSREAMNEKQTLAWLRRELRYRIRNYSSKNDYHNAVRDTCTELLRGAERKLGIPLPKGKGYCYYCHKEVPSSHFKNLSADPKDPEWFCNPEIRMLKRIDRVG